MSLHVRQAESRDITILTDLDHVAATDPTRREFIRKSVASGQAWVAARSGVAIGYATLEYGFFDQGFISLVIIDPAHRRQGAGTALVRHLESICRTGKLFTSTNQSNLPMQALLEKLGYSQSGIIHNLDEGDPELIYFKAVTTG